MPAPRIVVLGANGFVAGGLIHLLEAEGRPCRPVGSSEIDLTDPVAAAKLADILKPDDAIVVCSALTPERGRDRAAFLKNISMIDPLCAALAGAPCAHVVYISSDSVYGSRSEEIDEQSCCEADDFYGLAHIVREKMLAEACAAGSIPLALVRPSAIFGAGDTHNAYGPNRFVRSAISTGRIELFGEGEEQRDHISIHDVARIIHRCLVQRIAGVLNAVTGISLTFLDVAQAIEAALGAAIAIERVPRRVPVTHRRFDSSALQTAIPDFRATPFETAIRDMIARL
jgi:UDP-glucose 4-epimerase